MEEKTIQRIKKLQALAEPGVGGEKETAAKMLHYLQTISCEKQSRYFNLRFQNYRT